MYYIFYIWYCTGSVKRCEWDINTRGNALSHQSYVRKLYVILWKLIRFTRERFFEIFVFEIFLRILLFETHFRFFIFETPIFLFEMFFWIFIFETFFSIFLFSKHFFEFLYWKHSLNFYFRILVFEMTEFCSNLSLNLFNFFSNHFSDFF